MTSPELTLAAEGTQAYLSEGNLIIEAFGKTASNDVTLQLVHQDGTEYLQISDPGSSVFAGSGVIQVDDHTLRVRTAALIGNMTVIGNSGDNRLTIDLRGGNPITEIGLVFRAGDGHDSINILANGEDVAFFLGRTAGRGTITVGGRTIRFTGVESDTVTLAEAATVTLNLTGGDVVRLSQVSESRSRAEGLSNAVEFDSPTTRLVVNVLDTNDYVLHFNSLAADFNPADGIEIHGGGGNDTLLIDYSNGNSVPKAGIHFDGGSGDDLLQVRGTGTENPVYTPDANLFGNGAIHIGGRTISFTGLEPVDFDSVGTFTLMLPGGGDVVDINTGTLGDGISAALVLSGKSGGVSYEQARVRRSAIVIDTTVNDGDDRITITGADNAHDNTHLTILTGAGADTVIVNGKASFAGNVQIVTVDLTVNAMFQAGGTVTVTNTGTFTTAAAGDVSADGGFTQNGVGGNVLAGNITTAGSDVRFATAVTLTDDVTISTGATGGDIVFGSTVDSQATEANHLTLTTGAGNVTFTGALGSAVDGQLGAILITSAYDVTFLSTVRTMGDVVQFAGDGTTTFRGTSGNGIGGNLSVTTDTITFHSAVVTTVGSVYLTAQNGISINTGAGLDAGTSTIAITANESGGAQGFTQADGTTIQTTNASDSAITITVGGTGGAAMAALQTGGGGRVTITAGGAITDNNGPVTNITATTVALRAKTGIGTDGDAIETAQAGNRLTVAAETESGDIHLVNTGWLIVGTVDGLSGVTITNADGTATGDDNIHLVASSPLTIDSDVVNNDGGDITLSATKDGGDDDHLTINARVVAAGGDGNIFFNAGTDLLINGTGAAPQVSAAGAGQILGIADRHVQLAAGVQVRSNTGEIVLTADNAPGKNGGQFRMDDDALVASTGGAITIQADGDVILGGLSTANASAAAIALTSTSGAVVDGGDTHVDIAANSGTVVISAVTGVGSGDPLETEIGTLDVVNIGSGHIQINELASGGPIAVNRLRQDSASDSGSILVRTDAGTITVVAALQGVTTEGSGDILLEAQGSASNVVINAAVTSENGFVRLDATRDIVIQALIQAGGDILLAADGNSDGQGGLWVQASGKVAADGHIVGRGSDIFRTIASEADRTEADQVVVGSEGVGDGIRVDADNNHSDADQMVAGGSITLSTIVDMDLVLRGVIRTTDTGSIDLHPSGNILLGTTLATRGGRIRMPRPTVLIGDTVLSTNVTTELTDNNGTQDPSLGGDVFWVAGATIDSRVGQSHRLTVQTGTGSMTFNANVGETTALAALVIADTTGRITFGGADLASGDLSPLTLVRTYGDIDVGAGVLDADEASGGIVLNGGPEPDATLTFRTLAGGNVRFNGPVTLSSNVVVTTNGDGEAGTGQTQSGDIVFTDAAPIDSQMGEHNSLVLRAGTGIIRFAANVGQTMTLQSLTVEDTTGGVIFGTADTVAVDSETGPVTLVRTEGDLVLGDGILDHAGVTGGIVFNGGAPADELLVHSRHGAIRIRGNVTLGSTTTFRHTGEASLRVSGGALNILAPNSQLVIDTLIDPQADVPTDANPTGIIDSQITGSGRLAKTGAGWLKLTYQHDNTYGGGTTIADGTLSISKDGHLGSAPDVPVPDSILIDGATLYVRSDVPREPMPYTFWLDGHRGIALGPGSGAGYGELFVQRDVMVMYSGVVANNDAGTGSLRKTGGGILMLNGENTYTGTTYILAGTLLVNGSTAQASKVYVGGDRADDGVRIGGEPIRVTEQYAMLGGVGVVHGNVYVLGVSEVGSQWLLEPLGGHVNPGSILDQAEWIRTTRPDGTVVETWGLPTVPGVLTVGPIEFLPNSFLNIDFGNGGEVDPVTGWGKAPGFPYPGGSAVWADAFADWQNQSGPERGLPPVDRTGHDQLRVMGDLTINAAILRPNLQYVPLAWEAQFLIADFDGEGQVVGSLFQDRTYTIDGEDYVLRYDRGPNGRSIAFEAAGFTPMFRALPTPTAPVLVVARDLEAIAPAALRPYQEPPPPPLTNLAAGGEVVGGSERFVEVRVVSPIDDAGGVEETTVLKLPVSVLRDLRRLVGALPDDRYRVYLIVEYGRGRTSEEFLVRELYVREGRPVDRDERQPGTTRPTADDDAPTDPPADPNDGKAQGATEDTGTAALVPAGAVAAGAAVWQARVDQAIAKHAKRLPSKAMRLCRGMRTVGQMTLQRELVEREWEKGPSE